MSPLTARPHVAIFGAGAFGGWTALELARRGARVTLLDAWGPGHARASSGGDTRVIRTTYGSRAIYTRMTARAFELWRDAEARWRLPLLRRTGALWMFGRDGGFGVSSAETLRAHGIAIEEWSPADVMRRYPQIDVDGVSRALFEPDAGYLLARRSCEEVAERVVAEGGTFRVAAAASPVRIGHSAASSIALADGTALHADVFVFACGPWLGHLFDDAVGGLIASTRQEVYYFGTPAGDSRFLDSELPVWLDLDDTQIYGIPGNGSRGFKVADDAPGPPFDPTSGDRAPTATGIAAARRFLARRFPALKDAPLTGSEVCQYESTPDSNFIVDRHPRAPNVWIAGGGSGHGFKMGPAIGEMMASLILDDGEPEPAFSLRRFAAAPPSGWQEKWS